MFLEPIGRLLTTAEVADLLQVEVDTVVRWIRQGTLPASRLPRGDYRIAEADVARVLRPAGETAAAGLRLVETRARR